MTHHRLTLAAACAALLLAACDGASPAGPQGEPRAIGGCQWAQEGCDPPDPTNVASIAYSTTGTKSTPNYYKAVSVTGRSEAFAGVSNTTVSTDLKWGENCTNNWMFITNKQASAAGSPAVAQVVIDSKTSQWIPARWKAWSTHTFTPAPGYVGGGTHYTQWDSGCF